MTTAVDTSVLIAIARADASAAEWVELLVAAKAEGDLVICDVVAAEYFAVLLDGQRFHQTLTRLGIGFVATSLEASQLAGRIFRNYRGLGGPREHLIPDFLIGAHAKLQADRIAAIDRGFLRSYFPRLNVLRPA